MHNQQEELEHFLLHSDMIFKVLYEFPEEVMHPLSVCLPAIFWGYQKDSLLLHKIIHSEVTRHSSIEVAFREESIAVTVIKEWMSLHSARLIKKTLSSIIKSIMSDSSIDFELRTSKIIETQQERKKKVLKEEEIAKELKCRVKSIIKYLYSLLSNFERSVTSELANFAKILKYNVEKYFPGNYSRLLGGLFSI